MSVVISTLGGMTVTDAQPSPAAGIARDDRWVRRIVGTDEAEARAFFAAGYDMQRSEIRRTDSRFRWDFAGVGDGAVSLRTASLMAELQGSARSENEYVIIWNRHGNSEISQGDHKEFLSHGVPILLPFRQEYELRHTNVAMSLVHIDKHCVERALGETDPRFDSFATLSREAVAVWQNAVRAVSPRFLDMQRPPDAIERRSIADVLVEALVRTVPRDRLAVTTGRGPEHGRLRRALDYIHEHAHLPIGTPEIAVAADLSPRGLQQSFKRHLDTTPGEYLRGVRLEQTRADLRRADPAATTVAEIARAWGFGHLGRFSASYRARFGELPSETLRARS
jgi:AraC-like DNA-binding protein